MDNNNSTDTFFFTKNNLHHQSHTSRSLPQISLPTNRSISTRKEAIQDMFDSYHLFKYVFSDLDSVSAFRIGKESAFMRSSSLRKGKTRTSK